MPFSGDDIPILLLGGVNISTIDTSSQVALGENLFQAINTQTKNNLLTGQIYGNLNFNYQQPIASVLRDPDLIDTEQPMVMSPLGLED